MFVDIVEDKRLRETVQKVIDNDHWIQLLVDNIITLATNSEIDDLLQRKKSVEEIARQKFIICRLLCSVLFRLEFVYGQFQGAGHLNSSRAWGRESQNFCTKMSLKRCFF